MTLKLYDLDEATRDLMATEIRADTGAHPVSAADGFFDDLAGVDRTGLLLAAAEGGDDTTLASALVHAGNEGGDTRVATAAVPARAAAENLFNLYYMRALALRAMVSGQRLQVYRARDDQSLRPESHLLIGAFVDPQTVVNELRRTRGVGSSIGIPMPHTGLSVRLA